MDITWTEAVLSLGIGVGLAAATGMRVFLPFLVLGVAARMEWLPLSGGFRLAFIMAGNRRTRRGGTA